MNVWETDLPEEYFAEDRPFSLENASEEDFDISSYHGAIFFDASDERNMIDHNVVMHVHGSGIYQHDCDLVVIAHNLVVDCDYFGRAHPADQVPVGPFIEGWSKVRRQLQLVPNS